MGQVCPKTPKQGAGKHQQFGMVDARIIRDPSLPPNVKLVYTYLTTFCGKERSAFPSRARIARELGVSVRTVDTANRIAQDAGLFTIARKAPDAHLPASEEHHQPNVYLVHDFDGSYVVGSGPQRKICASPLVQNLRHPGATVAPYQDQSPGPCVDQTITPPGGDDCASVGHEQVRDLTLIKPKRYTRLAPEQAAQALVAVFAAAMTKVGRTASENAKDTLGRSLREAFAEGRDHAYVWSAFCSLLDNAWHGRNEHGWLVAPVPSTARGCAA